MILNQLLIPFLATSLTNAPKKPLGKQLAHKLPNSDTWRPCVFLSRCAPCLVCGGGVEGYVGCGGAVGGGWVEGGGDVFCVCVGVDVELNLLMIVLCGTVK